MCRCGAPATGRARAERRRLRWQCRCTVRTLPAPRLARRRLPREAGRSGRRWAQPLLLALALMPPATAGAAAFAARTPEADPPTGDRQPGPAVPEEPLARGNGIRWTLAPWLWDATLSTDLRWLRSDTARRSLDASAVLDVDFASYVWQPWFVQLRGGLGLLFVRSHSSGGDATGDSAAGQGLTARASASVFPASRFPAELRADLGDTRSTGETLLNHFRTLRLGWSQSWRPQEGNDLWSWTLDHSRVRGSDGAGDRLTAFNATGVLQRERHLFDLTANWSDNVRTDTGDRSRQASLSARHGWQDGRGLALDSLASWNDIRLSGGRRGTPFSFDAGLLQVATLASWRPAPGQWGYSEQAPLTLTASSRMIESTQGSDGRNQGARSIALSAGLSKDLSRSWRASAGLAFTQQRPDGGSTSHLSTGVANLAYTPPSVALGDWRWVPSAGMSLAAVDSSLDGQRHNVGVQASHGLTRLWSPAAGHSVSLMLSQSGGWLQEQPGHRRSQGLAHSGGLYWQGGDDASQSFASLSLSDTRTQGELRGRYQFINLQVSRRSQLSRYQSWSANLTLQGVRSDAEQIDPFTGERRMASDGWQRYSSGSLTFESQRVFGVPRLRFTALASVNSQQFERRANGDLDAPLERVTQSLETRLDWTVGRLDTRLSARAAKVDGRTVAVIAARAVRRF